MPTGVYRVLNGNSRRHSELLTGQDWWAGVRRRRFLFPKHTAHPRA
jgi:hypothetical protein